LLPAVPPREARATRCGFLRTAMLYLNSTRAQRPATSSATRGVRSRDRFTKLRVTVRLARDTPCPIDGVADIDIGPAPRVRSGLELVNRVRCGGDEALLHGSISKCYGWYFHLDHGQRLRLTGYEAGGAIRYDQVPHHIFSHEVVVGEAVRFEQCASDAPDDFALTLGTQ
jgi:hypothetical protein